MSAPAEPVDLPVADVDDTTQPPLVAAVPVPVAVPVNDHKGISTSHQAANTTTRSQVVITNQAAPLLSHPQHPRNNMMVGHAPLPDFSCMYCHQTGPTRTQKAIGTFAVLMMVILFLLFWPLCWIPLVMPGCKDTIHVCSNCHQQVAKTNADCDSCCR